MPEISSILSCEDIVIERIHELYEETKDIKDFEKLLEWWLENSLKTLLECYEHDEKLLYEIRSKAWKSIKWSAMKIEEVIRCVKEIIEEFEPKAELLLSNSEYFKTLTLIIVGSVGRMETSIDGDIDLNVGIDTEYIVESDVQTIEDEIIGALKKKLKERKFQEEGYRDTPFELLFTDKRYFYYKDIKDIKNDPKRGIPHLTNLLIGCYVITNREKFSSLLQKYYENEELLPREEIMDILKSIASDALDRTGRPPSDIVKRLYKAFSKALLILAVRNLEPELWRLNYFRLAEILRERNMLKEELWEKIREITIEIIEIRGSASVDYDVVRKSTDLYCKVDNLYQLILAEY